jgi:hypothetical protein
MRGIAELSRSAIGGVTGVRRDDGIVKMVSHALGAINEGFFRTGHALLGAQVGELGAAEAVGPRLTERTACRAKALRVTKKRLNDVARPRHRNRLRGRRRDRSDAASCRFVRTTYSYACDDLVLFGPRDRNLHHSNRRTNASRRIPDSRGAHRRRRHSRTNTLRLKPACVSSSSRVF